MCPLIEALAAGRDNDNGAYALGTGVKASCNTLQTSGFLAPSQRSFRMSLGENMFNFLGAIQAYAELAPALPPQRCV